MDDSSRIPRNLRDKLSSFVSSPEFSWWMGFLLLSAVLSMFTVYDQVYRRVGEKFIWDEQLRFHRWVIEGISFDPWQYRILAPYLIEGIRELLLSLGYIGSHLNVFRAVRLFQNFLIFIMLAQYFRRLSIKRSETVIALVMLTWSITYSGYNSHLGFDTYFDILFYIIAAYLILSKATNWIIPLSILVAFNRETGLFIPLMVIVDGLRFRPKLSIERKNAIVGVISFAIMVGIILSVRLIYGPRTFLEIALPGWDLFVRNIKSIDTYFYAFATFSVLPIIALLRYKQWPRLLVRLLWLMVPIWVVIHLFMGITHETRLFMVPFVLIFLPGVFVNAMDDLPGKESLPAKNALV